MSACTEKKIVEIDPVCGHVSFYTHKTLKLAADAMSGSEWKH